MDNPEVRHIQTVYNLTFLAALVGAVFFPRKKTMKAFSFVGCFGAKFLYFDNIMFFKGASEFANTYIL